MEPDGDSNARWLYRRCSAVRKKMGTPLTPLQLSIEVLRFIKSLDDDDDDVDQLMLFKFLKDVGKAKKRDFDFVIKISERAMELRGDGELSEEALRAVFASEDGTSSNEIGGEMDVAESSGGNISMAVDASVDDEILTKEVGEQLAKDGDGPERTIAADNDSINFDELHCFQLRTRVLGLSMPSFTTYLWKYLKTAGWTYCSGLYHIPKERPSGIKYGAEDIAKRVYKHFNLDNVNNLHELDHSNREESMDEEGPESFNANDLVDYLDELFCMPDYRSTPAEVQELHAKLSSKSKAYKRRNKRLRFELLEVAYRERTLKSDVDKSKYGHSHRPCEACFKATNHSHPRVACRECGLVVHTKCYGLLDYGEEEVEDGHSTIADARKGAEVDEKGFFTCDVCAISLSDGSKRAKRWNAAQSSGWRIHDHPNAVCPLCDRNDIAGAMVRIAAGEEGHVGASGKRSGKRKSRRSAEIWVHLFCINALESSPTSPGSIKNSSDAALLIQDTVKEAEDMQGNSIRCMICGNGKGVLVQCEGKCGQFFHRLCLQNDCLDVVDWNTKKEHLCLRCRGMDEASDDNNEVPSSLDGPSTSSVGSIKANAQADQAQNRGEEVDQYFERKSQKKSSKSEDVRSDFVIPSQQDCIAEVESLHRQCNADRAFDAYEAQYENQFHEWSFSMATNQSILLYGLGSKAKVLTSLGQYLSDEGDVVSLNGYDPNIDLDQFLDYVDQLFCDGSGPDKSNPQSSAGKGNVAMRDSNKGLAKKAASIGKMFALKRTRPLFMLIHNIDGVSLRSSFAQDAISILTTSSRKDDSPLIRVAASVDNVNAALVLWSPQVEYKFGWAWKKVHTYRPYIEEVRRLPHAEPSKKVRKSKGNHTPSAATAVLKVLTYLAPRHTEVLQSLAALQLSNSSNSVSYSTLRDECTRKMLTSSDTNLRNIMKELSDHKIIGSERDDEGIEQMFIPSTIALQDIIDFKPKQATKTV